MKRLLVPLVLLAGIGIALAVSSGGDAEAPGRPLPELAVPRLDGGGDFALVAIGGRDDAANGPAFVERHRLRTPTIVFDEAMGVWEAYAIPGQPAGVLLDREGREQARWLGTFDPAAVVAAARALWRATWCPTGSRPSPCSHDGRGRQLQAAVVDGAVRPPRARRDLPPQPHQAGLPAAARRS